MSKLKRSHANAAHEICRRDQAPRALAIEKLTSQIREFYDPSRGICGSPRIGSEFKDAGVAWSEKEKRHSLWRNCGVYLVAWVNTIHINCALTFAHGLFSNLIESLAP
jgi:hypothetical protein